MKRHDIHSGFAVAGVAVALWLGWQQFELHRQEAVNQTLSSLPTSLSASDEVASSTPDSARVRLAIAQALLAGGEFEAAEARLSRLASDSKAGDIAVDAQYNLANAYLRQALQQRESPAQALPLAELAKQRYRDLLKAMPTHWDARYNLELALKLAPEGDGPEVDESGKPVKSVKVIVPDFETRDLP